MIRGHEVAADEQREREHAAGRVRTNTAHISAPGRIHELTRDVRLEDVWALPAPGGPDDFLRLMEDLPRLPQRIASGDPLQGSSLAARILWSIRWKAGKLTTTSGPRRSPTEPVHGVMHIGWVPDRTGGYRGQMAVYVKPNGLFGTCDMAAIAPFRHLIGYPSMMRQIGRAWRARSAR